MYKRGTDHSKQLRSEENRIAAALIKKDVGENDLDRLKAKFLSVVSKMEVRMSESRRMAETEDDLFEQYNGRNQLSMQAKLEAMKELERAADDLMIALLPFKW